MSNKSQKENCTLALLILRKLLIRFGMTVCFTNLILHSEISYRNFDY